MNVVDTHHSPHVHDRVAQTVVAVAKDTCFTVVSRLFIKAHQSFVGEQHSVASTIGVSTSFQFAVAGDGLLLVAFLLVGQCKVLIMHKCKSVVVESRQKVLLESKCCHGFIGPAVFQCGERFAEQAAEANRRLIATPLFDNQAEVGKCAVCIVEPKTHVGQVDKSGGQCLGVVGMTLYLTADREPVVVGGFAAKLSVGAVAVEGLIHIAEG